MTLVVPNQGEEIALKRLLGVEEIDDLVLKLYKNDQTPGEAHTEADYTVADFTGYADEALTAGSWVITPGAPTLAEYPQVTFTSSAGSQNQPVYGYYVVTDYDGLLVWAERFSDGPYTIVNNGDQIKVTLKITLE